MKFQTILFYIFGLLISSGLGSLSAYRSDYYYQPPLRHTNTVYSQPRTNATFKIAAAGRVLGLSTAPHAQNRYPFARMALLNRDAHHIILPSLAYCKELTATQCAYFINYWLHKNSRCFRNNMLQQYPYYACPGFVQILQTFPEYEQHILYVAQQVHQDLLWTVYAKWYGIQDTIYKLEQEVIYIQKQRQEQYALHVQQEALRQKQEQQKVASLHQKLSAQRDKLENIYTSYEGEIESGLVETKQKQRALYGLPLLHSPRNKLYNQSYYLLDQTSITKLL